MVLPKIGESEANIKLIQETEDPVLQNRDGHNQKKLLDISTYGAKGRPQLTNF